MWLLDTTTIQLHFFQGSNIPLYAILSHTWGSEEVSFQDLQSSPVRNQHFSGYRKIISCCAQARSDGFPYVWIDTCCIDKTNSAELSEAINSMFAWYRHSMQCYASLEDVGGVVDLRRSRWFTRGWTLQELIAPRTVFFFNRDWTEIGSKNSLAMEISDITCIPQEVLRGNQEGEYSIAQKMSWASSRITTREEDIAYSLLGLFDVNMPMIYGEGKNAFRRLQLEIMKESNGRSNLAWEAFKREKGPLAESLAEFRHCDKVQRSERRRSKEYAMTNKGLRISLSIKHLANNKRGEFFSALLNCKTMDGHPTRIFLRKLPHGDFVRVHCFLPLEPREHSIEDVKKAENQEIYFTDPISSTFSLTSSNRLQSGGTAFTLTWESFLEHDFDLLRIRPKTHSHEGCEIWRVGPNTDSPGKHIFCLHPEGQEERFAFRNRDQSIEFQFLFSIHVQQAWCHLALTYHQRRPAIGRLIRDFHEFPNIHGKEMARTMLRDRITLAVSDDLSVSVSVRPGLVDGKKGFLANISMHKTESME